MGYLSREYFFDGFTFSERDQIGRSLSDEAIDIVRRWSSPRNKISKNGVRISVVMKNQLEIDLIPMVIPTAVKGFDIAGGTAAFVMYSTDGTEYLFDIRTKHAMTKSAEYYIYNLNTSLWISRNFGNGKVYSQSGDLIAGICECKTSITDIDSNTCITCKRKVNY